eukprot:2296855-Alexandrium_andersonii.AAC.1
MEASLSPSAGQPGSPKRSPSLGGPRAASPSAVPPATIPDCSRVALEDQLRRICLGLSLIHI